MLISLLIPKNMQNFSQFYRLISKIVFFSTQKLQVRFPTGGAATGSLPGRPERLKNVPDHPVEATAKFTRWRDYKDFLSDPKSREQLDCQFWACFLCKCFFCLCLTSFPSAFDHYKLLNLSGIGCRCFFWEKCVIPKCQFAYFVELRFSPLIQ